VSRLRALLSDTLVRNTGIYAGGQIAQIVLTALLVPVWARFLDPSDYAITGTLAAYSSILLTVLGAGLNGAAGKQWIDFTSRPEEQGRYLSSVIVLQVAFATFVLVALEASGTGAHLSAIAAGTPFRLMIYATYFASVALVPLSVIQHQQRAGLFVASQLGSLIVASVANVVLVVLWRWGAVGILAGQVISSAVTAVVVLAPVAWSWGTPRIEWRHMRAALVYGLPLVPYTLFSLAATTVDRFVLERSAPEPEIGAYNFALTLAGFVRVGVQALTNAWAPYYLSIMRSDSEPEPKIVRTASVYVHGVGTLVLAAILFAEPVVGLLFPARYGPCVRFLPPLLLAHFATGLFRIATLPLAHFDATRWWPAVSGAAAAVTIALDLIFVPAGGGVAAAWILLAGQVVLVGVGYPVGRAFQAIRYPMFGYALTLATLGAVALVTGLAPALLPVGLRAAVLLAFVGATWAAWRSAGTGADGRAAESTGL
jgi:O-antigen/teichoic acid export membrane protein